MSPFVLLLLFIAEVILSYDPSSQYFWTDPTIHLSWRDAQQYCRSKCNANLIPIQSISTYYDTLKLISSSLAASNASFWCGLNDLDQDGNYSNIDGTPYLSLTSRTPELMFKQGQDGVDRNGKAISWKPTWPHIDFSSNCVAFDSESNYTLQAKSCNSTLAFVCTHCNYTDSRNDFTYFISPNRYSVPSANEFCIDYCKSDMISIHNQNQFEMARKIARQNQMRALNLSHTGADNDIRIGLNQYFHEKGEWMDWWDDTPFTFGNQLNGEYPWYTSQPATPEMGSSVVMSSEYDYLWHSASSGTDSFVMCRSCDTKTHKYIVSEMNLSYFEAEEYCKNVVGTNLASIHSFDDLYNMFLVADSLPRSEGNPKYSGSVVSDAWVGLRGFVDDAGSRILNWTDGTEYDWGNNVSFYLFPFGYSENVNILEYDTTFGGDLCFHIDNVVSNTKLYGADCDQKYYVVCNAPSEIHWSDTWYQQSGEWEFNGNNEIETMDQGLMFIDDKQWVNYNGNLTIEYMYTIHSTAEYGIGAGIVLLNHPNSICDYYYFGIFPVKEHGDYFAKIFIATIVNGDYQVIAWETTENYDLGTYYLLKIEIVNSTEFRVWLNDELYIQHIDVSMSVNYTKYS